MSPTPASVADRTRLAPLLPWVQAVGAGVAMALALPGPGMVFLVLAVPGLLQRALSRAHGRRAFLLGWVGGTAEWLVAVPWIVIVLHRYGGLPLAVAVAGLAVMSMLLGLLWAVAAWATTLVPPSWRVVVLPGALVSVEIWQAFLPWNFPWNPVAAVAAGHPWMLSPVAVVTASGLSLLLLLLASGLEAMLDATRRRVGAGVVAAAVACLLATGLLSPRFEPSGPRILAAGLQPDVPLEYRWDAENLRTIEERVWSLTREAAGEGARWIVWPESAIPRFVERDDAYRHEIEGFAREHDVWLTVGSIGFGEDDTYFNSIFTFSPQGLEKERYDKIHLVPFGEYVPLLGRLAFMRPLVREVGSFTPGSSTAPVTGPAGLTGLAVCYEVAFPSLAAAEVRRGAAVLATITNDGWYGDSAAPRQHLALAVLRCAETRRYMLRAANTGISAVIGPDGRVLDRLDVGQRGLVLAELRAGQGVPPAAAAGAAIRLGIVLVTFGGILAGARRQSTGRQPLIGESPRRATR